MKNENKKLLATDGGELKLNGIARLHRQTTAWDGSPVDKLDVIIYSPDGTAYFFQKEIKSRLPEGIIAETCEALEEATRRWTEAACKKLQNGYLG